MSPRRAWRRLWQWIALGVAVAVVLVGWYFLPVEDWIDAFRGWIKDLGVWGGVVFAAAYVFATLVLLPVSLLTIVAGVTFGIGWGLPLVLLSATTGATLAFLVARYFVHAKVVKLVARRRKLNAARRAVGEGGWRIVVLLRLSPVFPFNLQNYLYGVTDIPLAQYVPATLAGILPGSLLYVYIGAAGKEALGDGASPLQWGFFGFGLIATVLVVVIVTRKAQALLKTRGIDA